MQPVSEPLARQQTQHFEQLLNGAERGRGARASFAQLRELGRLYRLHAAELARLRQRQDDPEAIHHLNSLCVRAYALLYGGQDASSSLRTLYSQRLPVALARSWRPQLLAWLLMGLGIFIGITLGLRDTEAVSALVGMYSAESTDALAASPEARARFLKRSETAVGENAYFGSYLFVHNTKVGLLSFASGILAGIPSILLQLYNGLLLGAFSSVFFRDPWPIDFLAWILPHGIPELTAICLCSAAGMVLGGAVIAPGRRRRRDALREVIDSAMLLVAAAIPLFVLAALIESFVRESTLGTTPRLVVAGVMFVAIVWGLLAVRRVAHRVQVDTRWLGELSVPARNASPGNGSAQLA